MNVFPFIEAEKAEQRNAVKVCCLLEVSRSAFYEWHQHIPSAGPWGPPSRRGQRIRVSAVRRAEPDAKVIARVILDLAAQKLLEESKRNQPPRAVSDAPD